MASRRTGEVDSDCCCEKEEGAASAAPSHTALKKWTRWDPVASVTIAAVAFLGMGLAWMLPWWSMEARAPQYGQRVLIVEVSPRKVSGDVYEIDSLGHYVGIRPIASVANFERKLGPIGLVAGLIGLMIAPFFRRKRWRLLMVAPVILMPIIFLVDLRYWVKRSATDLNPEAALNMTVTKIETKILGHYEVAQFKVDNGVQGGFYVASLSSLLSLGLIFAGPIRRRRCSHATSVAAGLALLVFLPVDGGAVTLQERIDRAAEGETLRVPGGTYRERLVLSKRIRLVGDPGAIIDGEGQGTVLTISASGTEVANLTLQNSGASYMTEDAAIRVENAADVKITGTRMLDTLFGVFIVMGDRCLLDGNEIIGKDLPHERRGDGVRLWYSHGCRVVHNRVDRSRDLIIWYSNDTSVDENVVVNSRYGLHYMYSDRNRFHGNRFEDNQVGAAVMYSRDLTLDGNSFSFSNGISAYGLLLKDADDVFIRSNKFVGNSTAMFFDNAPQSRGARVEVKGNLIARNDVGVTVQPNTRGIEFSRNSFIGNRTQVNVAGSGTADGNLWSIAGIGNFWSDGMVYDRDADGVSELPYKIEATFEALADRETLLAFFDGTPAATAIDAAARLFPIFAPRPKLTDSHPLTRAPQATEIVIASASVGTPSLAIVGAMLLAVSAAAMRAAGKRLG